MYDFIVEDLMKAAEPAAVMVMAFATVVLACFTLWLVHRRGENPLAGHRRAGSPAMVPAGQRAALCVWPRGHGRFDPDDGGRAITCRFDPNRDLYQRLLGTCFLDELDVNGWLVATGHAVAYTQYSRRYVSQEEYAKQQRLGIHAGRFVPPLRWRNGER